MLEIRELGLEEVLPLRTQVLRPHYTRGRLAIFDGDHDPETRHFGARKGGVVVGCATFMLDEWPTTPSIPSVRLRGMAVTPEMQGQGVGAKIMTLAMKEVPLLYPDCVWLWCNARIRAQSFYERAGLVCVGDVFEIEGVGPHVRMRCSIKP